MGFNLFWKTIETPQAFIHVKIGGASPKIQFDFNRMEPQKPGIWGTVIHLKETTEIHWSHKVVLQQPFRKWICQKPPSNIYKSSSRFIFPSQCKVLQSAEVAKIASIIYPKKPSKPYNIHQNWPCNRVRMKTSNNLWPVLHSRWTQDHHRYRITSADHKSKNSLLWSSISRLRVSVDIWVISVLFCQS